MTFGIERQSDQYGAFSDDPGVYASRDHVAVYDVPDGVPEYLVGRSIQAGLLNTRTAYGDPAGPLETNFSRVPPEGYDEEAELDPYGHSHQLPTDDPYAAQDPHAVPVQPLDQFHEMHHPDDFSNYHNAEPPPSFNQARRLTADDGPDFGTFQTDIYTPGDRLDPRSSLHGTEPERWLTALAVPPAQPAAPAAPVWLGHTYVPGHRVGMPWRDGVIPGTITHLEGYNVGVRWDDGQHSVEEPSGITPLH